MPVTPEQSRADSREPSLLKNRKFDKNWNDYAKDDWSEQWTAMMMMTIITIEYELWAERLYAMMI